MNSEEDWLHDPDAERAARGAPAPRGLASRRIRRRWLAVSLLAHAFPVAAWSAWSTWSAAPRPLGAPREGGSGWERRVVVSWRGVAALKPEKPGEASQVEPPVFPPLPSSGEEMEIGEPCLPEPRVEAACAVLPLGEGARANPVGDAGGRILLPHRPSRSAPAADGGGSGGPVEGLGEGLGAGGEVPAPVWNPRPAYPDRARRAGWEGTVAVAMKVGPDGRVVEADVVSSSSHGELDRAALEALRRWRFEPRGSGSAAVLLTQEVVFRLEER